MVVDDSSTDGSLRAIGEVSRTQPRRSKLVVDFGVKRGAAGSRNRAFELSTGAYLLFLDSDDYYEGGCIDHMAAAIDGADLCFAPFALETPDGGRTHRPARGAGETSESVLCRLLTDGWLPPGAIMWRRSFFEATGGWDARFSLNDDGELIARAMLHTPRLVHCQDGRFVYVQHDTPTRMSSLSGHEHMALSLEFLLELERKVEHVGYVSVRPCIGRQAYEIARKAFSLGRVELGRRAVVFARRCGYRRHAGSAAHVALAQVLGLELKERLSLQIRGSGA